MNPHDIATGHNPDQLTNKQVGVADGWRLLEPCEIVSVDSGRYLTEIQKFEDDGRWDETGWFGEAPSFSYRTKLTPSELREARGLNPKQEIQP